MLLRPYKWVDTASTYTSEGLIVGESEGAIVGSSKEFEGLKVGDCVGISEPGSEGAFWSNQQNAGQQYRYFAKIHRLVTVLTRVDDAVGSSEPSDEGSGVRDVGVMVGAYSSDATKDLWDICIIQTCHLSRTSITDQASNTPSLLLQQNDNAAHQQHIRTLTREGDAVGMPVISVGANVGAYVVGLSVSDAVGL